jgi:hypothetical protein
MCTLLLPANGVCQLRRHCAAGHGWWVHRAASKLLRVSGPFVDIEVRLFSPLPVYFRRMSMRLRPQISPGAGHVHLAPWCESELESGEPTVEP